ncbi:methylated-DNA--[protein]-cysteine S-methyltransferase [Alkalimarinus alittae]|uniref:Methylated-DNA--[protein]-cysteine S-methyltransferase n=1 Tax=Alkalimarinus alittae TaxID=2961619 RepID=A0ABY6N2Z3_9ALTE|nr:methylated-DNA--[protein]-cysteine S-methyltransferase [Alkalimarinus alittae]UZE96367.1 methylated-DNA--[protein]-cysteine S-methyltransferase [Alkalimarinus alittae]
MSAEQEIITYAHKNTVLGLIAMAATQKGVCFVQFGEDEEALLAALKDEFPKAERVPSPVQSTAELNRWIDALDQHISQGTARPDLPLDIRGTAFQMQVWQFLLSIPEGKVLSYSQLAEQIGKPKAFRAAASACGANRIGVLIPCHRVLRGDGSLGGYRWGLERKQALLDAEKTRNPSPTPL